MEVCRTTQIEAYWLALSLYILTNHFADSEVFSESSITAATSGSVSISSSNLSLSFRAPSGYHHFRVTDGCRLIRLEEVAPLGFQSLQHIPEPGVHSIRVCRALYVALSGFDYPLSGFLLPDPPSHLSGSSVHGIFPCRVLLPLKIRASSEVVCSLGLRFFAPGRGGKNPDFRALLPSKSRVLHRGVTQQAEPLLSWGYASLRL